MMKIARALLVVLVAGLALAAPAEAANITLDGQFGDWTGQANVSDPQGDAQNDHCDLQAFYFANNPGDGTAYFMAQRWNNGSQPLTLNLNVDTDNNGNYSGSNDRRVLVDYDPTQHGRVNVDLYNGAGTWLKSIAANASWGEAGNNAGRVEWGVSFADLGIVAFQTIRLRLVSMQGNNVCDSVAEVQWSPANALGWPLLAVVAVVGVGWLIYRQRKTG
jgi:hypothetical protein